MISSSPRAAPDDRGRIAFGTLLALFLAYAALFIIRTSFTIDGERYFSLFDDAMVSMRYARNLAHGYGLVWNPGGPRVEGYTNPLWVAYMAAIHLLPLPPCKTSLVVQVTAAAFLAFNLLVVRRIALIVSDGSEATAFGAVALTGSYLPLNNWSLQGTEVSLLVLVVSIALWQALRSSRDGRFRSSPYVWLAASTLVRPDMLVPLGGLVLFHVVIDPANRRRHLAWGCVPALCCEVLQTAFRASYFGDLLPNTYYLKMTGYPVALRFSRGAFVLARFIWRFKALLVALPFMLRVRRDRRRALLLWMVAVQCLYSVFVGGDAWEYWGGSNRYISIAIPGLFVLLSDALCRFAIVLPGAFGLRRPAPFRPHAGTFALLIALAIFSANSIYGPEAWTEVLLIRAPLHTGPRGENHDDVEEALALRAVTTPEATMTVARAGTIPYFSDRLGIDLLGKNDRRIAHEAAAVPAGPERFLYFRPGHVKFDEHYSIEQQSPDLVVQLWGRPGPVRPFLEEFYAPFVIGRRCVYVLNRSTHVLRDRLPRPGCSLPSGSASNTRPG